MWAPALAWLEKEARSGELPATLFERAERHLLTQHIVLPTPSTLERLVSSVTGNAHEAMFKSIHARLSPELRQHIDTVLNAAADNQPSYFFRFKEYHRQPVRSR